MLQLVDLSLLARCNESERGLQSTSASGFNAYNIQGDCVIMMSLFTVK